MIACIKKKLNYVSPYFTKTEFKCRCGCGQAIINNDLVSMLDNIRYRIGLPIIIHCVNRCEKHNKAVGGVSTSKHILGNAADFHVRDMSIVKLHEYLTHNHEIQNIVTGGLGLYDWGVHIDTGRYRSWRA
jgi:uncharacterized protein YcbK (DUF882 family)